MITREQVAELQPGDVVELSWASDSGFRDVTVTARGPLRRLPLGALYLANYGIRDQAGNPICGGDRTLTVVSRAPRPLYVNHPRTEPKQHDVIRDGQGVIRHCDAAGFAGQPTWWSWEIQPGFRWTHTTQPPQPLALLVDGETGRVVQ